MMTDGDRFLQEVADRMRADIERAAAPTPVQITVRDLLARYGYAKRMENVCNHIRNRLEELELVTKPDFERTWAGATVSIEMDPEVIETSGNMARPDPTYRLGMLEAAHNKPMSVNPNADLKAATTIMLLHDFTQLPVMEGSRNVKGIISWQTIGVRLALGQDCRFVRQCMDESYQERLKSTPLFDAIGVIERYGYVLVRDEDDGNVISGIVTASDLAQQFERLAAPFLLAGEIEGHLRNLVHRKCTVEELRGQATDGSTHPQISGPADLTLGDYHRLLSNTENWNRAGLNVDRKEFSAHLDQVRQIRNNVMHFNPDGLSDEDTQMLRDVARFFEELVRVGAL